MIAVASDDALCLLEFTDRRMLETQIDRLKRRFKRPITPGECVVLDQASSELAEYFRKERKVFDVEIEPRGSDFRLQVWQALVKIPYGETRSYGELAIDLGNPGSLRAVGRANGDNGIAIIVPCHRVVGADGTLTGYGGGLWRKRRLLDHESGEPTLFRRGH
ncbi:MAG: methylated-DNA--[protein]-cysteine S-methyltransferase [Armatimonadetes bacterium]|nr:methylated-DNA--[protein]-cysteine S-methyltransferase [Armatimonadota bacterium]